MRNEDWEPVYSEILADMGYDRASDENSARVLKALMVNAAGQFRLKQIGI